MAEEEAAAAAGSAGGAAAAEGASSAGSPRSAARELSAPLRCKLKVYKRVDGLDVQEWRGALAQLVRNTGQVKQALGHPERAVCGYSLRPLSRQEDSLDMEHVLECQMTAHAIFYCGDFREVLRTGGIELGRPLAQQGSVVQGIFRHVAEVQNGPGNLLFTTHSINQKKQFGVGHCLKLLDKSGSSGTGGISLQESLSGYFSSGAGAVDEHMGAALASSVVRKMRAVEGSFESALQDVAVDAAVGSAADRAKRERMYEALAEDYGALMASLHI